jgi:hypothetical protein
MSRIAQTMIHGISEAQTCALVGFGPVLGAGAVMVEAESSCVRKAGDFQISFGCQILRNPMRNAIEISEAPMSTIQGLTKLEIRNWGTANETPVTRIAGQT